MTSPRTTPLRRAQNRVAGLDMSHRYIKPRRKLTPKERVLKKYPEAHRMSDCGLKCVGSEKDGILAYGRSYNEAWADAARRLK